MDNFAGGSADLHFTAGSLEIMKRMKNYGGEATCNQLAAKYGESSFYSTRSNSLARRIAEKTGCPIYSYDFSSVSFRG